MKGHTDICGADHTPYCPWWCEVCNKHHPVPGMVEYCESRATEPDDRPKPPS